MKHLSAILIWALIVFHAAASPNKIAVGCGNSIFLMSTVQISASVTSGSEAAQTIITLTVTADAPVSGNQTVDLDVSGFDVFPSDYLLSAPTITILDGETEASATFTISDDMVFEGNETATISLTNLSAGLTLGMITSVNISIIDNEFCPSFTTEPDNVTIINSSCDMGCSPAGGEIIAPTGSPCPAGSTIQYFDGSSWSYTLPVYDQDGPAQTISTRCTCDEDNTYISSESVPVTTAPASCTPITCYLDQDGDGFGNINVSQSSCNSCATGYVSNGLDCDDSNNAIGSSTITLPPHSTLFTGNVRGYTFTSPASIRLTSLYVPTNASGGNQSIAVLKFNTAVPTYSTTTNDFSILYLTQNNVETNAILVDIEINEGDIIGILGQRSNVNSYGNASNSFQINGITVPFTRLGMQFPLITTSPKDLWVEPSSPNISRVFFTYCDNSKIKNLTTNVTYGSLQDAIDAAADGDQLMLLQDIVEGNINTSKSVCIEANGFSLSLTGTLTIPNNKEFCWLENTLVIEPTASIVNMGTLKNNGTINYLGGSGFFANQGLFEGTGSFDGTMINIGTVNPGN